MGAGRTSDSGRSTATAGSDYL
nr:hypothetical protein [Salmonella enterica]